MEQKFNRGNKVRIKFGWPAYSSTKGDHDSMPQLVNQEAIIYGSYKDLYGGDDVSNYQIILCETGGSLSWMDESQLALINKGGEHLFEEAEEIKNRIVKLSTDLASILSTWNNKKEKQNTITMKFLLTKIGFESAFDSTGEFFHLYNEWITMVPLIDAIMNHTPGEKPSAELSNFLTKEYPAALLLWDEIDKIKKL